MATVVKSCRWIEEAAGKGPGLKPLLETVAQALDKENIESEGSHYILFSLTIIFLNIDTIGNLLVKGIKIP